MRRTASLYSLGCEKQIPEPPSHSRHLLILIRIFQGVFGGGGVQRRGFEFTSLGVHVKQDLKAF